MKRRTSTGTRACTPRLRVEVGGEPLVSTAGAVLLTEAARATGVDRALSAGLARWRRPRARHDPGRVLLHLATSIATGGDCLADIGVLRAQPDLFGVVASDPTVSRLVDTLAGDVEDALAAVRAARAAARTASWAHRRPVGPGPVVIDIDGSLVVAHSDKQSATPTFKQTFGFHPLLAFVDHGAGGSGGGGEVLAAVLRPGNANANNSADHIAVLDLALAQLPEADRARVLVRADSGGATKAFLHHVVGLGLQYSVGFTAHDPVEQAVRVLPTAAWTAAYDADEQPRDGAQVAELTGLLPDLTGRGWPPGMRVIARRERPHPGAQLRQTDPQGWRITVFATNTRGPGPGCQLADLELRHRRRARAEDRIRTLKDSGLRNLPLHDFAQNQIWVETVLLASDLLTWTATLGLVEHRRAEPRRLRLRLLHVAARVVRTGRRVLLRLPRSWPWAGEIAAAHARLLALPAPG